MVEIVSLDDDDHDYVDEDHDDIRYFEVTDSSDDYDTKTLATENNKIIRNGELEEKKLSSGLTTIVIKNNRIVKNLTKLIQVLYK